MKVLILGIDGMIGHKIAQSLFSKFELFGTTRRKITLNEIGIKSGRLIYHDFLKHNTNNLLKNVSPDVIINCVGITIRRGVEKSKKNTELINSRLPHFLDEWSNKNNCKLIHFSTDCVFSGNDGNYLDNSLPDAVDAYGISKAKGELDNNYTLTIRSSMIGREIYNHTELFEWLFSMRNKSIEGYSNVIYSGITTVRMAKILESIIDKNLMLSGIYNVSSIPISKFNLLNKLSSAFSLDINISENPNISSNKILISKKFTEITGINSPNWDDLIMEFKEDSNNHKNLYKN